ncbi:hypothetical protein DPMN_034454, partial [Dreissena polymorpha]
MAPLKPVVFSVLVVALFVLGIFDVITNYEENKCEMTWMFEMPQYLRVPMSKKIMEKFPNYGLYVYGEGQYAVTLQSMQMTGVPVLFIPGNAGSYKQVRSLASVAFRRAVDKRKLYHFNFFSVDLNEEYSGLYGSCLQDQTEFVHEAIKKIFGLYKNAEIKPKTIILVGHSMGGLVARGLFTLPNFNANQVNTIYMQATPNQSPVVVTDADLASYHQAVNTYWRAHGNTTLAHVTLVSSGGGEYDVQVRGGLTPLDGITDEERGISSSTTHIPKAWVSTDHRCIVWCKQVVLAFVRSMFDIVREDTHVVSDDIAYRMHVFRHHFVQNPGSIGHVTHWPDTLTLQPGQWSEVNSKLHRWRKDKVDEMTYLSIPIGLFDDVDHAMVQSNIMHDSWVCVCERKEGEEHCTSCHDISFTGNVLPPLYSNKKVVHLDLNAEDMLRVTHIVVIVPATEKQVEILWDVYRRDKRHLSNTVPGLMETMFSYPESITKGTLILDLGTDAAFYRLKLYNMNNVLKVYTVQLHTAKCREPKPDDHAGSVIRLHIPWNNEDSYRFVGYSQSGNLSIRLQNVPPDPIINIQSGEYSWDTASATNDHVELYLHLDPSCSYKVTLALSFKEMLGQLVRFYGLLLPTFCVAVLLMSLVFQLKTVAAGGQCPSLLNSIWQMKPYFVVPFALVIQYVLQLQFVQSALTPMGIPEPDIAGLNKQGVMFKGAQLLLYVIALAITTFQAGVIHLIIQFKSRLLGLMFGWLPSSLARMLDKLMTVLVIAGLGAAVCLNGSLGIFVCYFVSFVKLLRLCYSTRQVPDSSLQSRYHLMQTLFMLWLWLFMLNAPPLVVFGKAV